MPTATLPADVESPPFEFPELQAEEPTQLVEAIRGGLPAERFDVLKEVLDLPARVLAEVVGITQSTLSRRRQRGYFDPDESERIVRIARLAARAVDVMEGPENARKWLQEPSRALGGESPLRFASVEPGAREVERLLLRLEHGVHS